MRKFNNDFIGYLTDTSLKFSGSDNEDRFEKNLKTQPHDWYYRNAEITYDYNDYGHRCKNLSEIDLDNYILFSGCSHTEGIGLELEKTFPYLISNTLGIDYYNLALGGSGIDTMAYNLIAWINTVKKPPKAVVITWTYETRFLSIHDDNSVTLNLAAATPAGRISPVNSTARFMILGEDIGYFASKKKLCQKMTRLCYNDSTIIETNVDDHSNFDFARDLMHLGIMSHQVIAKKILDKLK
jgi:hypothetical protein